MLILCISVAIGIVDQLTKAIVRSRFLPGESVTVVSGLFDLRYIKNTGAAWGILEGFNGALVIVSAAVLILIVLFRRHIMEDSLACRVAAGLMLGGIVGNLIDRLRLGYVVDFLDFYWRHHHFPAFNVADSSICVGVGLYVLLQSLSSSRQKTGVPSGEPALPEAAEVVPPAVSDGRREEPS